MTFGDLTPLRFFLATCLVAASADAAMAQPDIVQRGRAIVLEMCGQCHAIDRTGRSPREGAPAFREIDIRVDLDRFTDQLRKGLLSTHKDMPSFRFTREEARAIVAYLRFIQAP